MRNRFKSARHRGESIHLHNFTPAHLCGYDHAGIALSLTLALTGSTSPLGHKRIQATSDHEKSQHDAARELIQADLDHAYRVLQLWQDQVAELERTLGQLDAVDASRNVLRVEYQGQQDGAAMPGRDSTARKVGQSGRRRGRPPTPSDAQAPAVQKAVRAKGPRKLRKSTAGSEAAPRSTSATFSPKRSGPGKKKRVPAVKYQDPASGKTWSGRGRKPSWLAGDADQYLVSNLGSRNSGNPDAAEPVTQAKS